jgi:hypothetical protein
MPTFLKPPIVLECTAFSINYFILIILILQVKKLLKIPKKPILTSVLYKFPIKVAYNHNIRRTFLKNLKLSTILS